MERSISELPGGGAPSGAIDPAAERIREIAEARASEPGPLLEILHDVQHEFGYLPDGTVTVVADVLNLSIAEVHGVQSFYHDFRSSPPADVTVAICRGEACQAVGAEALVHHATTSVGCGVGEQTTDGAVGIEQVFCFGNCALGPTAMVAGRLHGRMDAAKLDALVADARATTSGDAP